MKGGPEKEGSRREATQSYSFKSKFSELEGAMHQCKRTAGDWQHGLCIDIWLSIITSKMHLLL